MTRKICCLNYRIIICISTLPKVYIFLPADVLCSTNLSVNGAQPSASVARYGHFVRFTCPLGFSFTPDLPDDRNRFFSCEANGEFSSQHHHRDSLREGCKRKGCQLTETKLYKIHSLEVNVTVHFQRQWNVEQKVKLWCRYHALFICGWMPVCRLSQYGCGFLPCQ